MIIISFPRSPHSGAGGPGGASAASQNPALAAAVAQGYPSHGSPMPPQGPATHPQAVSHGSPAPPSGSQHQATPMNSGMSSSAPTPLGQSSSMSPSYPNQGTPISHQNIGGHFPSSHCQGFTGVTHGPPMASHIPAMPSPGPPMGSPLPQMGMRPMGSGTPGINKLFICDESCF